MNIQIRSITKKNVTGLIPELLRLEHNWTGIGEKAWERENFERELPSKWDLTIYANCDGKIAGYAICSVENNAGKLDKLIIDKKYRNRGIATKLWDSFRKKCQEKGIAKIEFKVLASNKAAQSFYRKKGMLFYGSKIGSDGKLRHLLRYTFKMPKVSHSKPTIDDSDIKAVSTALKTGDVATGNVVRKFCSAISAYIGKKYAIATNSGTSALHLALRSLNIKEGDEVILPSYVCISVLNSVLMCRAKPVLVDINRHDYNISFKDTKNKISKRTKAIIIPHMFGQPVRDIEAFLKLNVPIIEDCAQAIGASLHRRKAGNFGIISIFSFYATKMITSGVGGAVLTDDDQIMQRLQNLTKNDERESLYANYNYKMSDIQAALALSQLKKLNNFVKRRKIIAKRYTEIFNASQIDFKIPDDRESIFYRYVIAHDKNESFIGNLNARGLQAEKPVFKCLHAYLNIPDRLFPNASRAFEKAVSIPIYPSLTDSDVEDIASLVVNWKNESPEVRK